MKPISHLPIDPSLSLPPNPNHLQECMGPIVHDQTKSHLALARRMTNLEIGFTAEIALLTEISLHHA